MWGFVWQEDYNLGDTLGCLILETLMRSEFARSPSGQEGGWSLLGGCHLETLLSQQSQGP